ncbi:hypothetical protein SNEBB_003166 [Seison nebaliae]|nr:hypothetical protein SNEBB_003166 [Seison nebaliae]
MSLLKFLFFFSTILYQFSCEFCCKEYVNEAPKTYSTTITYEEIELVDHIMGYDHTGCIDMYTAKEGALTKPLSPTQVDLINQFIKSKGEKIPTGILESRTIDTRWFLQHKHKPTTMPPLLEKNKDICIGYPITEKVTQKHLKTKTQINNLPGQSYCPEENLECCTNYVQIGHSCVPEDFLKQLSPDLLNSIG